MNLNSAFLGGGKNDMTEIDEIEAAFAWIERNGKLKQGNLFKSCPKSGTKNQKRTLGIHAYRFRGDSAKGRKYGGKIAAGGHEQRRRFISMG